MIIPPAANARHAQANVGRCYFLMNKRGRISGNLIERTYDQLSIDVERPVLDGLRLFATNLPNLPDDYHIDDDDYLDKIRLKGTPIHNNSTTTVTAKLHVECSIDAFGVGDDRLESLFQCDRNSPNWHNAEIIKLGNDRTRHSPPYFPERASIEARLASHTMTNITTRERVDILQNALSTQYRIDNPDVVQRAERMSSRPVPTYFFRGCVYLVRFRQPDGVLSTLQNEELRAYETAWKIGMVGGGIVAFRNKMAKMMGHRWESKIEYVVIGIPPGLDAREVEKFNQFRQAEFRLNGEWFDQDFIEDWLPEFIEFLAKTGCRVIEQGYWDHELSSLNNTEEVRIQFKVVSIISILNGPKHILLDGNMYMMCVMTRIMIQRHMQGIS
jgi:hypothetical protein